MNPRPVPPALLAPLALLIPLTLTALTGCGARQQPDGGAVLPLKRVRLYETGVAYFERSGELKADEVATLPVPAGHIDDALKTLTVVTRGQRVSVQGLSFSSSLSRGMARALAGLPLDSDTPVRFEHVLAGLKGQQVELQTEREKILGRPIAIAAQPKCDDDADGDGDDDDDDDDDAKKPRRPGRRTFVLVMTADGTVRQVDLEQIHAVRPIDEELKRRLGAALKAFSRRNRAQRALSLLTGRKGPLTLGYIAEVPLWRASYRLVTSSDGQVATLQSWALIHNDADEDWRGVKVELVSGRPDSFLYPLAVPRYLRRPLVHPDQALPTVPQLLDTSADELWGDQLGEGEEGIGTIGHGGGGGSGSGYGRGVGRLVGRSTGEAASTELSVGDLSRFAQAAGAESGALFSYTMPRPLTLRSHGSALIPFLQAPVQARRITLLRQLGAASRSAVLLSNSTGQTLPAGTIAIFGGGGFTGEAFLERTKPNERRFLEYGTDLDVEVKRSDVRERGRDPREEVKKLVYRHDKLEEHFLRHRVLELDLKNRAGEPRLIYLGLQVKHNAKIQGADALDFDTQASRPIAIFKLAAGAKAARSLTLVEALSREHAATALSAKRLGELAATTTLPQAQRAAVAACADLQRKLEDTDKALSEDAAAVTQAEADLKRLRAHLAAAGGKGAAANPLIRRILQVEDRLSLLQQGRLKLQKAREQDMQRLVAALKKLG